MPRTAIIICGLAGSGSISFRSLPMLTSKVFPPSQAGVQIESAQIGEFLSSFLDMVLSGLSRKYWSRCASMPGSRLVCPLHETSRRLMSMVVPFSFIMSGFEDAELMVLRRVFMRFARTRADVCLPAMTSVTPQSKSFSSICVITLSIITIMTVRMLCRYIVEQKGKIRFPKTVRLMRTRL